MSEAVLAGPPSGGRPLLEGKVSEVYDSLPPGDSHAVMTQLGRSLSKKPCKQEPNRPPLCRVPAKRKSSVESARVFLIFMALPAAVGVKAVATDVVHDPAVAGHFEVGIRKLWFFLQGLNNLMACNCMLSRLRACNGF